jgi:hypothetical protein
MIKRQYRRGQPGYFNNFILSHDPEGTIEKELKMYNATLAKSKNRYYLLNVKWQDHELYTIFVLRYS